MNDVLQAGIAHRIESFLRRKTNEHPEIIEFEKWARYEYTPRRTTFGEKRHK